MLRKEDTLFVLVDVQGKLARIVHDSEKMIENLTVLIQGLRLMSIPIVWLEQYPEGLGPTHEEVAKHLNGLEPIPKITFDACKHPDFVQAVEKTGRKQVLIAGIETHICVYQTALGLSSLGYEVQTVADAVSSRTSFNKELGLERMRAEGIMLTSVEMVLYELLQEGKSPEFKEILKLLK